MVRIRVSVRVRDSVSCIFAIKTLCFLHETTVDCYSFQSDNDCVSEVEKLLHISGLISLLCFFIFQENQQEKKAHSTSYNSVITVDI